MTCSQDSHAGLTPATLSALFLLMADGVMLVLSDNTGDKEAR